MRALVVLIFMSAALILVSPGEAHRSSSELAVCPPSASQVSKAVGRTFVRLTHVTPVAYARDCFYVATGLSLVGPDAHDPIDYPFKVIISRASESEFVFEKAEKPAPDLYLFRVGRAYGQYSPGSSGGPNSVVTLAIPGSHGRFWLVSISYQPGLVTDPAMVAAAKRLYRLPVW